MNTSTGEVRQADGALVATEFQPVTYKIPLSDFNEIRLLNVAEEAPAELKDILFAYPSTGYVGIKGPETYWFFQTKLSPVADTWDAFCKEMAEEDLLIDEFEFTGMILPIDHRFIPPGVKGFFGSFSPVGGAA